MKKSKLLIPALSIAGLTAAIAPIATSCSCNVTVTYTMNYVEGTESLSGLGNYETKSMEFKKDTTYNFELTIDSKDTRGILVFCIATKDAKSYCTLAKISTKVDGKDVESSVPEDYQSKFLVFDELIKDAGKKVSISITAKEDFTGYAFAGLLGS